MRVSSSHRRADPWESNRWDDRQPRGVHTGAVKAVWVLTSEEKEVFSLDIVVLMADGEQTACNHAPHHDYMDESNKEGLLAAELLNEGVVLKFADGRCAYYSTALLSKMFAEAEEMDEAHVEW